MRKLKKRENGRTKRKIAQKKIVKTSDAEKF